MTDKKGFTLVEIIVSICLLAVIMAAAVPGLMNYFADVDEDKYVSETKAIVAQVESSYSQLSLSGSYGANVLPDGIKNNIVKEANGSGEIDLIEFSQGKMVYLSYKISDKIVTYDNKNEKKLYSILYKSVKD